MRDPDPLTIPACIGCGAMRQDLACPGPCAERRIELVSAGDYDRLVASAAACRARVREFRAVAEELAGAGPAAGMWQAAYQALQQSARSALRGLGLPAGRLDDLLAPVRTVVVWRCPDCGGLDAPQPCLGVCIWRPARWVDAASYEAVRSHALADRDAEQRLAGLPRTLASITPRAGQWEQNWRALRGRARDVLAGPGSS